MELGTIDLKIYRCISNNIDTNRVIITNEQLKHILLQHPESFIKTFLALKEALVNPDYILKDNKKENTGLVIKRIDNSDSHVFIVLRICTNSKKGIVANSVISGWIISQRRLNNYLRKRIILYKKE